MLSEPIAVTLTVIEALEALGAPCLIGGSRATMDTDVLKGRPFDQAQFERRTEHVAATDPERTAYVTTAEDIVLAKLEWYRMGDEVSERQWRDVLGVLRVQGDRLDLAYLRRWAAELEVTDLLERALTKAGQS